MRTLLIEFHRFNDLSTGMLRVGDPYLAAAASHPVREFKVPLGHADFLNLLSDLRYKSGTETRHAALKEIGGHVAAILGADVLEDLAAADAPLQLDLVVNPAELAALPFEAVLDREGSPLIARGERTVELTRRVRREFVEKRVLWPARPRILYAWACPPGAGVDVPFEEHGNALRKALEPWMPPQMGTKCASGPNEVLTILEEASLDSIREACRKPIETNTRQYTHVHLLAHGYPVGRAHEQRFGLALHIGQGGDLDAVTPEALAEALAPLGGQPVMVTLAACDSANSSNTLVPERSIAHQLHVLGIPVVVASQLPFTVPGSVLLTERFYGAMLAGKDVRVAIHEARVALYESRVHTGHDWASLVGYVSLPEGYAEHLLNVRLESVMASLKNAQSWSDELVKDPQSNPVQFDHVAELLQGRIRELEDFWKDAEKTMQKGVLEENLGLLGSAEKRLAELYFERGNRSASSSYGQPMRSALERANDWYRRGFDGNLSNHWAGVQYLSLEAILRGSISDPGRWHAAVTAAEIDRRKPKEFWAHGSLAELFLLAPAAGQPPRLELAAQILREMVDRVAALGGDDRFPIETTQRQFRRYTRWWTVANGFFPGTSDLAAAAASLAEVFSHPA